MQNRFGLLDTDVMPMFMIIALDIIIILHSSINCSAVICSPTIIFAILREATSETTKIPEYLSYYLYQISLLQVAVKGLTTPSSRWLQGS